MVWFPHSNTTYICIIYSQFPSSKLASSRGNRKEKRKKGRKSKFWISTSHVSLCGGSKQLLAARARCRGRGEGHLKPWCGISVKDVFHPKADVPPSNEHEGRRDHESPTPASLRFFSRESDALWQQHKLKVPPLRAAF